MASLSDNSMFKSADLAEAMKRLNFTELCSNYWISVTQSITVQWSESEFDNPKIEFFELGLVGRISRLDLYTMPKDRFRILRGLFALESINSAELS